MIVKQFVFNAFQENCYLVADEETRHCAIIDPGMNSAREMQAVADYIGQSGFTLERVLLTHCHLDHVLGTGWLADVWPEVPIGGPVEDGERLPSAEMQSRMFGMPVAHKTVPLTANVNEGDRLKIGQIEVQVYDIPGHSFHGLCYYLPSEGVLFTGDVLFCCSVGRSDFGPGFGCDGEALVDGIRCKLMSLPPETTIYPGHGPSSTIGQEITYNPYI